MDALEDCDDAELVSVYWELRASNGSLLTCARYRHARGEDVRVGAPGDPVLRIQLLSDGETGEQVAEYWKRQILGQDGGVDEPQGASPPVEPIVGRLARP